MSPDVVVTVEVRGLALVVPGEELVWLEPVGAGPNLLVEIEHTVQIARGVSGPQIEELCEEPFRIVVVQAHVLESGSFSGLSACGTVFEEGLASGPGDPLVRVPASDRGENLLGLGQLHPPSLVDH